MKTKDNTPLSEVFSGSTRLAIKYGVNAAIVHAKIAYYINENKKADRNKHNGKYWTYFTYPQLAEDIGFLTPKQVRAATDVLRADGLLEVGHFNSLAADHTNWYTIPDKYMKAYPHIK